MGGKRFESETFSFILVSSLWPLLPRRGIRRWCNACMHGRGVEEPHVPKTPVTPPRKQRGSVAQMPRLGSGRSHAVASIEDGLDGGVMCKGTGTGTRLPRAQPTRHKAGRKGINKGIVA